MGLSNDKIAKDNFIIELGQRIRSIRKAENKSIEEIAYKANIDAQNLRKYELGKQEMRVSMLARISAALNLSVSELTKNL